MRELGAGRLDAPKASPDQLTVIGFDISEHALKKLYAGNEPVRALIHALIDKRGERPEVDPSFVETLTIGVREPVLITDLGLDVNGKRWIVLVDGRQRTLGLRVINQRRVASSLPPLLLITLMETFPPTADGNMLAMQIKALCNRRVESLPTELAWLAHGFVQMHTALEAICPFVGVESVQSVKNLLLLLDCSPKVQKAVDLGAKKGGISQEVARRILKIAGDNFKLQDEKLAEIAGKRGRQALATVGGGDAAPGRVLRRKQLEGVRKQLASPEGLLDAEVTESQHLGAVLQYVLGDASALEACSEFFRVAVEKAAEAAEAEKIKPARIKKEKPAKPEGAKKGRGKGKKTLAAEAAKAAKAAKVAEAGPAVVEVSESEGDDEVDGEIESEDEDKIDGVLEEAEDGELEEDEGGEGEGEEAAE